MRSCSRIRALLCLISYQADVPMTPFIRVKLLECILDRCSGGEHDIFAV